MKTRTTRLTVSSPEGLFDVEIADEGLGEFVMVSLGLDPLNRGGQHISISPDEWPHLREAIDRMVGEIKGHEEERGLWDDVPEDFDWEENPQGPPDPADEYLEPPHDPPGGWIPWVGGECPLTDNVRVDLKWSNGDNDSSTFATYWRWEHLVGFPNIAAYRVVSEEEDDDENAD